MQDNARFVIKFDKFKIDYDEINCVEIPGRTRVLGGILPKVMDRACHVQISRAAV